ncbi:hypothetical protein L226DRAFT_228888 [Lentinus tigrinus ALCF2SS1-7]|uniref:Cupredoxin n=1 Tax=Lentinus tigrinus ALCF2SS1-6 TaxID=1328759 RepID=A0A5C2S3C5_9APHY|nr:hypothetical protein L227DRAFT_587390 [Lentinus tigrinus ALCF2SS1-6]RPD70463.1 hypothetical protein L226DRAFT_228888 [Lentinus tigrinus ALCF2SS1-7]
MRSVLSTVLALSAFSAASAKQIVVTVGGNTTTNTSAVFQPAQITNATIGDTIFFNFTKGNHTATQSTFASPCIPAHDTNVTINGFDSGFRDTVNGTAITNLVVPITDNGTIWFYDANTCAAGGVGGINVNDSSTETLDGFRRNAIRLNGTKSSSSASGSGGSGTRTATSSRTSSTSATSGNTSGNGAERSVVVGLGAAVPMIIAAMLL